MTYSRVIQTKTYILFRNRIEVLHDSIAPARTQCVAAQPRSHSPRYPCSAERENEDLWDTVFQLDISLANNRACAIVPEVDKQ